MCWLEFKMLLVPAKRQDPSLHMGKYRFTSSGLRLTPNTGWQLCTLHSHSMRKKKHTHTHTHSRTHTHTFTHTHTHQQQNFDIIVCEPDVHSIHHNLYPPPPPPRTSSGPYPYDTVLWWCTTTTQKWGRIDLWRCIAKPKLPSPITTTHKTLMTYLCSQWPPTFPWHAVLWCTSPPPPPPPPHTDLWCKPHPANLIENDQNLW